MKIKSITPWTDGFFALTEEGKLYFGFFTSVVKAAPPGVAVIPQPPIFTWKKIPDITKAADRNEYKTKIEAVK